MYSKVFTSRYASKFLILNDVNSFALAEISKKIKKELRNYKMEFLFINLNLCCKLRDKNKSKDTNRKPSKIAFQNIIF